MYGVVTSVKTQDIFSEHRLLIDYQDLADVDEVCLDVGFILPEEGEEDTNTRKERIIKALSAIAESRID